MGAFVAVYAPFLRTALHIGCVVVLPLSRR